VTLDGAVLLATSQGAALKAPTANYVKIMGLQQEAQGIARVIVLQAILVLTAKQILMSALIKRALAGERVLMASTNLPAAAMMVLLAQRVRSMSMSAMASVALHTAHALMGITVTRAVALQDGKVPTARYHKPVPRVRTIKDAKTMAKLRALQETALVSARTDFLAKIARPM